MAIQIKQTSGSLSKIVDYCATRQEVISAILENPKKAAQTYGFDLAETGLVQEVLAKVTISTPTALLGMLLNYASSSLKHEDALLLSQPVPGLAMGAILTFLPKIFGPSYELAVMEGHEKSIFSSDLSTNGKQFVTGSIDGTAILWDLETANQPLVLKGDGGVFQTLYSPDGKLVATGSYDHQIRIWDTSTGGPQSQINTAFSNFAFSPDGTQMAVIKQSATSSLYNTQTGEETLKLYDDMWAHYSKRVHAVAFSPDGKYLFSDYFDSQRWIIMSWNIQTGEKQLSNFDCEDKIVGLSVSPDGNHLAAVLESKHPRIFNLDNERELALSWSAAKFSKAAVFSHDSKWVATVDDAGTGLVSEVTSDSKSWRFVGHNPSFSADGKFLTTTDQNQIVIYNTTDRQEIARISKGNVQKPTAKDRIVSAHLSPDGRLISILGNTAYVDKMLIR